jgi:hypothetical protein
MIAMTTLAVATGKLARQGRLPCSGLTDESDHFARTFDCARMQAPHVLEGQRERHGRTQHHLDQVTGRSRGVAGSDPTTVCRNKELSNPIDAEGVAVPRRPLAIDAATPATQLTVAAEHMLVSRCVGTDHLGAEHLGAMRRRSSRLSGSLEGDH